MDSIMNVFGGKNTFRQCSLLILQPSTLETDNKGFLDFWSIYIGYMKLENLKIKIFVEIKVLLKNNINHFLRA